jgi:hypothetical protein
MHGIYILIISYIIGCIIANLIITHKEWSNQIENCTIYDKNYFIARVTLYSWFSVFVSFWWVIDKLKWYSKLAYHLLKLNFYIFLSKLF